MSKEKSAPPSTTVVRIPVEQHKELNELSALDGRTVPWFIETAIANFLEDYGPTIRARKDEFRTRKTKN